MGLTQAQYARHRKRLGLPGATPQAVSRAIKDGRINRLEDETIDPAVADAEWAQNSLGRMTQTRGEAPETPEVDYNAARARRELANAELAELKLAEARGDLVRRDSVQRTIFDAAREVRNRLLAIPARVAPRVAGESDIVVCQQLIGDELQEALEDLVPAELRAE